jgi:hypothetical protein
MSDPVAPVSRPPRPRRVGRRALLPVLRAESAGESRGTDAKATPVNEPSPASPAEAAAFAAQLMGQGGQKRGLRGGAETLDHARHTYLETEWSGGADRRHARGRIAKREV